MNATNQSDVNNTRTSLSPMSMTTLPSIQNISFVHAVEVNTTKSFANLRNYTNSTVNSTSNIIQYVMLPHNMSNLSIPMANLSSLNLTYVNNNTLIQNKTFDNATIHPSYRVTYSSTLLPTMKTTTIVNDISNAKNSEMMSTNRVSLHTLLFVISLMLGLALLVSLIRYIMMKRYQYISMSQELSRNRESSFQDSLHKLRQSELAQTENEDDWFETSSKEYQKYYNSNRSSLVKYTINEDALLDNQNKSPFVYS